MSSEEPGDRVREDEKAAAAQFTGGAAPAEGPAWEEVAEGRYMPRRIRGSYRGRALG